MRKHYLHLGAVVFIGLLIFAWGVAPAFGATEHCPDKDHPNKVEVSDDFGPSVTVPEGSTFCVKAGNEASGILTSNGTEYTVTWLNNGGQTPNISYYIVYDNGVTPSPEPSPTPTETPGPEPTPSVTPTAEPTPTNSPSPVAVPQEPGDGGEQSSESVEELPNTGLGDNLALGALALFFIAYGTWMIKRSKPIV